MDGAGYQSPSRVRRVRDDGSRGNGNWLHAEVIYQINILRIMGVRFLLTKGRWEKRVINMEKQKLE